MSLPTPDIERPLLSEAREKDESAYDLQHESSHDGAWTVEDDAETVGQCGIWPSVFNLSTTAVGAGLMALPRAVADLGLLLGTGMIIAVHSLSYFSLVSMVRSSHKTQSPSYAALVKSQFGVAGARVLQGAVAVNAAGIMVVYLIMLGDVLAGKSPPGHNGSGGMHSSSTRIDQLPPGGFSLLAEPYATDAPATQWYLTRAAMVGGLCLFILAPLVSLRQLGSLAWASVASMTLAVLFSMSVTGLAATALAQGRVQDIHWLPNAEFLGSDWLQIVPSLLAVLPVIMLAYICHFNLHPVVHALKSPSEVRIRTVLQRALGLCSVIYLPTSVGGYVLFGRDTASDVLQNFTVEQFEDMLGTQGAEFVCIAVRFSYCCCLLATFCLVNWALQESLAYLAFGRLRLSGAGFYVMTYSTLLTIYLVSVMAPSVWVVMSLMGSSAAVTIAFILPGLVTVRTESESKLRMYGGYMLTILGVVLGVVGLLKTLIMY